MIFAAFICGLGFGVTIMAIMSAGAYGKGYDDGLRGKRYE